MLLRGPVDTDEPPSFFVHHALPSNRCHAGALDRAREHTSHRNPIRSLYWRSKARSPHWASVAAVPPGHLSGAGALQTRIGAQENVGCSRRIGSVREGNSVRAVARGSTRRFATLHSVCYRATTFLEPRGKGTGRMALSFLELANWEIGLSGRERHQPRKCERLWTPPAGFSGVLQADAFAGYNALYDEDREGGTHRCGMLEPLSGVEFYAVNHVRQQTWSRCQRLRTRHKFGSITATAGTRADRASASRVSLVRARSRHASRTSPAHRASFAGSW